MPEDVNLVNVVLLTVPCLSSSVDLALGEDQMVAFCLFFDFSYEKNLQIFLSMPFGAQFHSVLRE